MRLPTEIHNRRACVKLRAPRWTLAVPALSSL